MFASSSFSSSSSSRLISLLVSLSHEINKGSHARSVRAKESTHPPTSEHTPHHPPTRRGAIVRKDYFVKPRNVSVAPLYHRWDSRTKRLIPNHHHHHQHVWYHHHHHTPPPPLVPNRVRLTAFRRLLSGYLTRGTDVSTNTTTTTRLKRPSLRLRNCDALLILG